MNLPMNGGVVVIDDNMQEALPLLKQLSKEGISYSYYDGSPHDYPENPLDSVRIVFTDMQLDGSSYGGNKSHKNVLGSLISGLNALIAKDNGPYIIFVWSKNESQYLLDFKKMVNEENALDCKPLDIISMEKAECFVTDYKEDEDGKIVERDFVFRENGQDILRQKLSEKLELIDAFVLLYNWENGIKVSAARTIDRIDSLNPYYGDNWNSNLKSLFYEISKAYAGKTLRNDNTDVIHNLYLALWDMLQGITEAIMLEKSSQVNNISCLKLDDENKDEEILETISEKGNEYKLTAGSKKYFVYANKNKIYSGDKIKKIKSVNGAERTVEEEEMKKRLIEMYKKRCANVNSLLLLRNDFYMDKRPGNVYLDISGREKQFVDENNVQDEDTREKIKAIELEVSPICDFSQNKRSKVRILPGYMVPDEFWEKNNAEYYYVSPVISYEGNEYKMVFDFKEFTSEKLDYLDDRQPIFTINDDLLHVIKEKMFSHGSRSGIVSLMLD